MVNNRERISDNQQVKQCSRCGKKLKSIKIITRVGIMVSSFYVRRDKKLEDMNGLSKSVNEFLCENCFDRFVDYIEQFSDNNSTATPEKVPVAKKKSPAVKTSTTTKSSVNPAKKTVKKSLPINGNK